MGYIQHGAVILTTWDERVVKAVEAFRVAHAEHTCIKTLSQPIGGVTNGYVTFVIAPDGSKEGWGESDRGEAFRNAFLAAVRPAGWSDIVRLEYGGDFTSGGAFEALYLWGERPEDDDPETRHPKAISLSASQKEPR